MGCIKYLQAKEVQNVYKHIRNTMDDDNGQFRHIFEQAERMARHIGEEPSKPRTTSRQQHRNNAGGTEDSPFMYYKNNLAIPLVDHIIAEMSLQFSGIAAKAVKLLGLVPSVISIEETHLSDITSVYETDLPSPATMQSELMRWRLKWTSTEEGDRPTSLAKAIKSCDSDGYPNIYTLLKIACTLPVTSCECERSISVLRRLDSFIRHSMTEERLSALALIHIHYNHHVDLNEAVDIFSKVHPRCLELDSVLL